MGFASFDHNNVRKRLKKHLRDLEYKCKTSKSDKDYTNIMEAPREKNYGSDIMLQRTRTLPLPIPNLTPIPHKRVLSFDVGIKHLSFCLVDFFKNIHNKKMENITYSWEDGFRYYEKFNN